MGYVGRVPEVQRQLDDDRGCAVNVTFGRQVNVTLTNVTLGCHLNVTFDRHANVTLAVT